jgi:hypothetical protein
VTLFENVVLAVLFVAALEAVRGIAWFALAVMVLVPNALDGLLASTRRPKPGRVSLGIAGASVVIVLAAFAFVGTRPDSWFERSWPPALLAAVESAAVDEARVFPSDRHADWILWKVPSLRGRVAYDTRFELYDERTFERLLAFNGQVGDDWKRIANGYEVVVVYQPDLHPRYTELVDEPGARIAFRDRNAVVIERTKR